MEVAKSPRYLPVSRRWFNGRPAERMRGEDAVSGGERVHAREHRSAHQGGGRPVLVGDAAEMSVEGADAQLPHS